MNLIFILLYITSVGTCGQAYANKPDLNTVLANEILLKTHKILSKAKTVQYKTHLYLNYPLERYKRTQLDHLCLNFTSGNQFLDFRFILNNNKNILIFNGIDQLTINKSNKTIKVSKPELSDFKSITAFFNSIVTLRKNIPLLVSDKSTTKFVSDTIINNVSYFLISIDTGNKVLLRLGGYTKIDSDHSVKNVYKILVEKESYLPKQVIQSKGQSLDAKIVTFDNIELDVMIPEKVWSLSSYQKEYSISTD